ncbi:MAG: hypothetical protein M3O70_03005, partial [Actinomycetota bacterium]|nr:hypothetical protein [Actinomycetota bacterium]
AVVYVATSKGLYRSTDAGRTYANVSLPTGECAGRTDDQRCIFANYVTDVVVQAPDRFGNPGGEVLAAVGFRGGSAATGWPNGEPYAPYNGLYRSPTGEPGSFVKLPAPGFAPQERIGRVELGVAEGPAQNHDYVYAVVQDAVLLSRGIGVIDAPEEVKGPKPLRFNTNLNGVYVSADFGQTWKLMADETQISESPLTGSALIGVGQATYAPGIQAWYNLFIKPDPTRQTPDGIPTRLTFGLEEVWQNPHTDQPQDGRSEFKVIGRYYGGETCMRLAVRVPVCPTNDPPTPSTTTHPDQHDALYLPDGAGGATLVVGNDGGVYTQHAVAGQEFTNARWGTGDNEGFNTLLPYHAVMAKDGTVWLGLQDNGTAKIEAPSRKQFQTFGGDGFFVAVDPDDSDVAYSESTQASIRVTTDGGRTWRDMEPPVTNAKFSNPFVMDPTDSDHLMTAGREVVETTAGPDTQQLGPSGWMKVFDLGTRNHPGDPTAQPDEQDPANSMSALDLHGDAAYVGFCGYCEVFEHTDVGFQRGLATNVGGDRAPRRMTGNGWHFAAAKGLPNRYITSIAIDPADPKTVYVTLGGYGPAAGGRQWVPPGSYLDPNQDIGHGHVFKSVDAGETFVDISGNLPDAPAYWVVLRGSQLLLGTEVGPFISRDTQGSDWDVLGVGLPNVPISTLELAPHDPNLVV